METIKKMVDDRFKIIETLGEGYTSVVYKAEEMQTRQIVAIKLMKKNRMSDHFEDIVKFKNEIQNVSLMEHENIIKIYDIGEYGKDPYIVMENLEGCNMEYLFNTKKYFREEDACDISIQILKALEYAHKKKIVHADLNPSNVFIIKNDDVKYNIKIIDFGISVLKKFDEASTAEEMAGTFGFMAPEAIGVYNGKVDERSDLYSLGVILYRMLTGQLPFRENSVNKLIYQQLVFVPQIPEDLSSKISTTMQDVVNKLLLKEPDLRYQSAAGALHDLKKISHGQKEFVIGEKDKKTKITYITEVVGREHEIDKIKELFDKSTKGNGSICFIKGDSGVGKSRLVEEVRRYVYERNGLFLKGKCLDTGNKIPYQPFKDVVDDYLFNIKRKDEHALRKEIDKIKNVVGDFGEAVVILNPLIEKLLGKVNAMPTLDPERELKRFFMLLSKFFYSLNSDGNACLMFLDDFQWADEGSLKLLEEILARIGKSNLFILCAYRDKEIASKHTINRIIRENNENTSVETIKLDILSIEQTGKLIGNILLNKGNKNHKLNRYIYQASKGNPFFIINIIRDLIENKLVHYKEKRWMFDNEKLKTTTISTNIVEIILKRIRNQAESLNEILCIASVIGKQFNIVLLMKLLNIEGDEIVKNLLEGISRQFIEKKQERGVYVFVHDKIKDAFYKKIDPEKRKKIHKEIAEIIEEKNVNPTNKVLFELAHHYTEALCDEKALKYILPAAKKAWELYAHEDAVKYYIKGLEIIEKTGTKYDDRIMLIKEDLTEIYIIIGKNELAIELANQILVKTQNDVLKTATMYEKMGTAYFKKGDWENSESYLLKALDMLGEKIPKTSAGYSRAIKKEMFSHLIRGIIPLKLGRNKKFLEKYKKIVWIYSTLTWRNVLNETSKVTLLVMRMLNYSEKYLYNSKEYGLGLTAYATGCMTKKSLVKRGLKYHKKGLEVRKKLDDNWGIAQSLQSMGYSYSWMGCHPKSIDFFNQSLTIFSKIGDMWELAMVYYGLGKEWYYMSDYKKAIAFYGGRIEIGNRINDTFSVVFSQTGIAECNIEMGFFEEARKILSSTRRISKKKEQWLGYCCDLKALGHLELEIGDYNKAIKYLEEAKNINEKKSLLKDCTASIYYYLAEAYMSQAIEQSDNLRIPKDTLKKINSMCEQALTETQDWPNHYGGALRVTAKYYTLVSKWTKAKKYFRMAIKHTETFDRKFETAKSLYEYGVCLDFLERQEQAKENLTRAYNIFAEVGSREYAKKCAELLGVGESQLRSDVEGSNKEKLNLKVKMNYLLDIIRHISSTLDLDQLLNKITESIVELVGAEKGILYLYSDCKKTLEMKVHISSIKGESGHNYASKSIIARVEKDRKPLILNDALSDDMFFNQPSVLFERIRSVLCAPIIARDELIGIIYLDNNLLTGLFSQTDVDIVEIIANQAGISIENAKLYNSIKVYSKEVELSRNKISESNKVLEKKVTERTMQLEEANNELLQKNMELKKYSKKIEELTIIRERNRFALDLHDTLGNTMSLMITLLEVSNIALDENPGDVRKNIEEALRIARGGLKEIRGSVMGLMPDNVRNSPVDTLKKLISNYAHSGVKVDFSYTDSDSDESKKFMHPDILYRICQEALTNAVRHGKAKNVTVLLQFTKEYAKLFITDDGCGCKDIKKGVGLSGMEQRVKNLNGMIKYGSDSEKGFNIYAKIPIGGRITGD